MHEIEHYRCMLCTLVEPQSHEKSDSSFRGAFTERVLEIMEWNQMKVIWQRGEKLKSLFGMFWLIVAISARRY